jgi:hypothetical protein
MVTQSAIFSIIILDYQVVIIKHNHKSHMNIVKWHFYIWTQQTSLTHIWGCRGVSNQYMHCKENNLTSWNTWATKATRMTTFHDDYQRVRTESYLALVPSSTWYLDGHPWVTWTLSHYTFVKWGKISSNSATVEATNFARPRKSRIHQYIINACCNRAQPTRSLIDTSGGYLLWSSEHENTPLTAFPIRYSLLSPSYLARSQIV